MCEILKVDTVYSELNQGLACCKHKQKEKVNNTRKVIIQQGLCNTTWRWEEQKLSSGL